MPRLPTRLAPLALLAAVVLPGCDEPAAPPFADGPAPRCPGAVIQHYVPYDLEIVPERALWYQGTRLQEFDGYPQDADGVILYEVHGRYVYNPIQMGQKGLWFVESYEETGDSRYLTRARAHADRLLLEADTIDGGLYFPYPFDFELHRNTGDVMPDPWYSGMAQGTVLNLIMRLHAIDGDSAWYDAAERVQRTLQPFAGPSPTLAFVDCDGYYWIEEYPHDVPNRTLNGFIFAVWGLYDHWRMTGDQQSHDLVRAALATLKDHLWRYRVPGEVSYYDLIHRPQIPNYHRIHIEQMLYLHRMTGDEFFRDFLYILAEDTGFEVPEWWWEPVLSVPPAETSY